MSRIDELIEELCPEGVATFPLAELFVIRGGYTPSKSTSDFWEKADIPWFRMEDVRQSGRELFDSFQHVSESAVKRGGPFEKDSIIVATTATIGEHALVRVPFLANQQFSILTRKSDIREALDAKFAYYVGFSLSEYCLRNTNLSGFASVNMEAFRNFPFPLPPLEVQREIVSILDKFTQLEAELEAELEARKIQYEVTRDRLLDFSGDLEGHPFGARISLLCPSGIQVRPLGDLVINRDSERKPVTRGLRQAGKYPYYGANGIQDYVDSYLFEGTFLLIGEDGSVMRMDGTPVLNWASGQIWVNNHAHVLQARAEGPSLRFLYFFLSTVDVSNFVTGGTQKKINQGNLNKIPVPVPPLEIQNEIVSVLDKLDALVNDITIGLPAEIAARRKQYENYRNKLLTFKKLEPA